MVRKQRYLGFPLMILFMILSYAVLSEAIQEDNSLASLALQMSRLEQRIAQLEQGLAQVAEYVSKGTQETRGSFRQIASDVASAVDRFSSQQQLLKKEMSSVTNQQKQSNLDYQNLLVKFNNLEQRLLETESQIKLLIGPYQLASNNKKLETRKSQLVRRFKPEQGSSNSNSSKVEQYGPDDSVREKNGHPSSRVELESGGVVYRFRSNGEMTTRILPKYRPRKKIETSPVVYTYPAREGRPARKIIVYYNPRYLSSGDSQLQESNLDSDLGFYTVIDRQAITDWFDF